MCFTTELPPEWALCISKGKVFFFNLTNGSFSWEHPLDLMNMQEVQEFKQAGAGGPPEGAISPNMPVGFYQEGQTDPNAPRYLGNEIPLAEEFTGTFMDGARMFEEVQNPEFQLTPEIFVEYAIYLGINPDSEADQDLMELAEQGLLAPLPDDGWKPCLTGDQQLLYFNFNEGDAIQEHPVDSMIREQIAEYRAAQ